MSIAAAAETALRHLREAEDRQLHAMTIKDWDTDQETIDRQFAALVAAVGEREATNMMGVKR